MPEPTDQLEARLSGLAKELYMNGPRFGRHPEKTLVWLTHSLRESGRFTDAEIRLLVNDACSRWGDPEKWERYVNGGMEGKPPTEKQLAFLKALGWEGSDPEDRRHASQLITELKAAKLDVVEPVANR